MDSSKDQDDGGITSATTPSRPPAISGGLSRISLVLRSLLFAVTVASIVVMVTGKQTKEIISLPPFPPLVMVAKFDYSPSFIYFVAAISVACVYSLVSTMATAVLLHRSISASGTLSFLLVFFDALILGIVASATGAGASIAYVGVRGNSHVGWIKICNMFDKFCWHVGGSLVLSAAACVILVLLTMLSTYSLHRRAR